MARITVVVLGFMFASLCTAEDLVTKELRSRIQVIPLEKSSFFTEGHARSVKLLKNTEFEKVAGMTAFPKWKTYKDNRISFRYPDNPHLKLSIKDFQYSLLLGKEIYARFYLMNDDYFLDVGCFCGAVAARKYLTHNKALYRFDLLADGRLKRIQVLSKNNCIVFHEWTHSLVTQRVFLEMALSVQIAGEGCDVSATKTKMLKKDGFQELLDFLEKQMPKARVIELLGKPDKETDTTLKYVRSGRPPFNRMERREQCTVVLTLKDGYLPSRDSKWVDMDIKELPHERGSVPWIVEMVGNRDPVDFDEKQPIEERDESLLSKEQQKYVFDRFVALAPKANSEDWELLCMAIDILTEQGPQDNRVLPIMRKRFSENLNQSSAARFLRRTDRTASLPLFAAKIRHTLDGAKKYMQKHPFESLQKTPYGDFASLVDCLGKDHPKATSFVKEGMVHPHPDIRRSVFAFWRYLTVEDARKYLIKGLTHESSLDREQAAEALAERITSKKDVQMIRKLLESVKDESIADDLREAIEEFEQE
jgi:hypothetical protein